ncbi:dihydrodipicolinate synthase family protein [Roseateles sp.]|uniref:dihydrodipicolinate synthase family protein n=1 Tax=Roseateles sp. TaxID=1971397 RepID=UPI0025EBD9CA|nr:dihydrodipicolinate synthase family protein [Roseateles sp.]MBV8035223.1 dihydrodipicolinate synthase family protein [Roseateles sp.]
MSPQELKAVLQAGLLSFPLTDFDALLNFAPKAYAGRLEWLQPYGASALFAAGGTGEFFSLEPSEYGQVIQVALDTCDGLIRDFFLPYIAPRNQGEGYAVSIVKAGATLLGHSAGPVSPPLSELSAAQVEQLGALIARLGPQ